jgi:hypothetical protein
MGYFTIGGASSGGSGLTEEQLNERYLSKEGDTYTADYLQYKTFDAIDYQKGIVETIISQANSELHYSIVATENLYGAYGQQYTEIYQSPIDFYLATDEWNSWVRLSHTPWSYNTESFFETYLTNNDGFGYINQYADFYELYGTQGNDWFQTYADSYGWGTWHRSEDYGNVGIDLWSNDGFGVYGGQDGSWSNKYYLFIDEDYFDLIFPRAWQYQNSDYWGTGQYDYNDFGYHESYIQNTSQLDYPTFEVYGVKGNDFSGGDFNLYADSYGWGMWNSPDFYAPELQPPIGLDFWSNGGFNVYEGDRWSIGGLNYDHFISKEIFYTAINDWEYYQYLDNGEFARQKGYQLLAPETIEMWTDSLVYFNPLDEEGEKVYQKPISIAAYGVLNETPPALLFIDENGIERKVMPSILIGTDGYVPKNKNGLHIGETVLQTRRSLGNEVDTARIGFGEKDATFISSYHSSHLDDGFLDINSPNYSNKKLALAGQFEVGFDFIGNVGYNQQHYFSFNLPNEHINGNSYANYGSYYNGIFNDAKFSSQQIYGGDFDEHHYNFEAGINENYYIQNYFRQEMTTGLFGDYSGVYADGYYNQLYLRSGVNQGGIYNVVRTFGGVEMIETNIRSKAFTWQSDRSAYANHAAADTDTTLPSKAFYKLTGDRAVYQKP